MSPGSRSMGPSPLQLSTSRVEITMSIISVTPIAFFGLYSITARSGPGATRWISARPDTTEHIVIEFDRPQTISRLVYEVEETMRERTQEVRVEVSEDGGRSYRQILVQEYNFSPGGATYQREEQRFNLRQVTHLRLTIVPNKSGSGTATLTALLLFA